MKTHHHTPHAIEVIFPLINANEPEARLVEVFVQEGQKVSAGDLLCTLETTKASHELHAEVDGFVVGLRFHPGDLIQAGELLCYLASDPAWRPPETAPPSLVAVPQEMEAETPPAHLRITQPAWRLVRAHRLDISHLPKDQLVTEEIVRQLLKEQPEHTSSREMQPFDATAIIIYGGGGHGKALIDLLRSLGSYQLVGIVDDGLPKGEGIMGVTVLGGKGVLAGLYAQGVRLAVNAVGGIGSPSARVKVFQELHRAGFACPTLIHPTAWVEPSATLSSGVQVFPHAYVGSNAHIGFGSIINSGAIVSHDCSLGAYVNLSPGAILAGEVVIEDEVLIGMGVTVNLRVRVAKGARIGNGATIKEDVPENQIVRAGSIWPDS